MADAGVVNPLLMALARRSHIDARARDELDRWLAAMHADHGEPSARALDVCRSDYFDGVQRCNRL